MTNGELLEILIQLFGGLGLFLYGMNVMSEGLEKAAGERMKKFIEVLTKNRIMGVIVGAFVTMIVQSSSATTVMVVGFVNAGIMNLTQAISLIMGANIGTTITAQLVAFKLTEVAPIAIALGVFLKYFSKNQNTRKWAEILLGFGILFLGMGIMSGAMKPLRSFEGFRTLIASFGSGNIIDTVLAIFTGFAVTAIVQSSSATTAIMVSMATAGLLPIDAAFPILLGTNIGTCVTAMISSISASKTAKRAALMHLLFNVVGTAVFAILLAQPALWFVKEYWTDSGRQLAMMHTTFNVVTTLIMIPFAGIIVKAVERIIPIGQDEMVTPEGIKYLDDRILETPSIALGQVMREVLHMGNVTKKSLKVSTEALVLRDAKKAHEAFELESTINNMEHAILDYLVKLSNTDGVSLAQREIIDGLFSTVKDIERVGDHADNLAELALYSSEHKVQFSAKAIDELKDMTDQCVDAFSESLTALKTYDLKTAQRVMEREGQIDLYEKQLRKKHIGRLNDGSCDPSAGVVFLDAISNLERVGDHSSNIALAVMDYAHTA